MLSHHNESHDQVEPDHADCNAAADEATRTVTDKADQVWEQTGRAGAGTPHQDTEAEGTTMEGGLNTASLTLEHLADQFMQALSLIRRTRRRCSVWFRTGSRRTSKP